MKPLAVKTIRIKNFKAVRDSEKITLSPLTIFIGNNGSGKSSVVEGLETIHRLATEGLDAAMGAFRGMEHIRYKGGARTGRRTGTEDRRGLNPIELAFSGHDGKSSLSALTRLNERTNDVGGFEIFVEKEGVRRGDERRERDDEGNVTSGSTVDKRGIHADRSILGSDSVGDAIAEWQFLSLSAQTMGDPVPEKRSAGPIRLAKDGSNLGQYLLDFIKLDAERFEGLLDVLRYVLPYAKDLQPAIASELTRSVYLQMSEEGFKVPGWLLSTGTLRILAFLAVLRHPKPPRLLVIDEIENGLDPRTLALLVEEIHSAVTLGGTQVIATSHSPYLLDLVSLESIIVVERVDGQPTFRRPADDESVREWAREFSPGSLYTMSRFERER